MSEKKAININWITDRIDDDILYTLKDINNDLLSSVYSIFGYNELDDQLVTPKEIKFNNSIIKTKLGNNSGFSVGATIVALTNRYDPFVIPPDLIEYIRTEISSKIIYDRYVNNLPRSEEDLLNGKHLVEEFLDAGYPLQAAYSLVGSTWTECHWNPNIFNSLEKNNNGTENTGNWSGCGEGLFGLTFWNQKKLIIERFNLYRTFHTMYKWKNNKIDKSEIFSGYVSNDYLVYNHGPYPNKNNNSKTGCLFQLTEDMWVEIMKSYIEHLGTTAGNDKSFHSYLTYNEPPKGNNDEEDDDHKLLYASYLYKAAPGLVNNKKSVFDTVNKYKNTHKKQSKKTNFIPINGFVEQLLAAYIVSLYCNEVDVNEISLNAILPNSDNLNIKSTANKKSFVSSMFDSITETVKSLFKKGNNKFDIEKACKYLTTHSKEKSQHVCAKFVRKALEAGGINTSKRPDWAWKYINYLPTIGFKLVDKLSRNQISTFKPEPGDIAVYMQGTNPNVPGHICMYTGNQWCSDFKQKSMMVYSSTPEAYVFRYDFGEEA